MKERGQSAAELALILPLRAFLACGILQLVLLFYGGMTARFAAWAALRSAAVAESGARDAAAAGSAVATIGAAPGVRLLAVTVEEAGPGGAGTERLACAVRVGVPRLVPLPMDVVATAGGRCALPMEPTWDE